MTHSRQTSSLPCAGALAALVLATGPAACAPAIAALPASAAQPKPRLLRASVAFHQDFGLVGGRDLCTQESQLSGGYGCFRSDGIQYHGTPLPQLTPRPTRLEVATTRLLVGADYVLFGSVTVGARGGIVLRGGGPRQDGATAPAFLPVHGEVRVAYWFGSEPLSRLGLRGGVFLAAGAAQVDTAFGERIEEDTTARPAAAQPHNPAVQTLDVYRKSGTGFVCAGLAAAYAFREWGAIFTELKWLQLFPSEGGALAPTLGYEHAF